MARQLGLSVDALHPHFELASLRIVILLIEIVRGGFGICFIGRLTQAQIIVEYHSGLATVRF